MQKDTTYYYMNTFGNRIAIASISKMSELNNAAFTTIWSPPSSAPYSKQIWAPEMHYRDNKWYVYFTADDGVNDHHRIYALECDDADPRTGKWIFKGKIADTLADKWAIDATVFEYNRQLYMAWSGWEGDVNTEQVLYLAKMKDPLTMDGGRVKISSPVYDWEKVGASPAVNEGPEALVNKKGQLFLTFSASGCWTDSYSLGLLTLKPNGDPMNPADWKKSPAPVFSTVASAGAYAPGHNGFFTSRDGKENWIIYHANSKSGQGCGSHRNPRMQQFTWKADGSPDFGVPVKIGEPLRVPGGE
jgi:GH43 family beta-xylosidase